MSEVAVELAKRLWERVHEDGDVYHLIGPGSQTGALLCRSIAEASGRSYAEIRREFEAIKPRYPRLLYPMSDSDRT